MSEEVKIVADSGSTKCDWAVISGDHTIKAVLKTKGMNPYFHDRAFILEELGSNPDFEPYRTTASEVFFYGAGCSSKPLKQKIRIGLKEFFSKANINVDHDLNAAAYACYNGEPEIACILGTGSNSCYFDGQVVSEAVPSLAYILGDEGSGSYYGKQLLRNYFYNKMPDHLTKLFEEVYSPVKSEVIDHVYRKPNPNVYLASFMRFVSSNINEPYLKQMMEQGMRDFFDVHVTCYSNYRDVQVNLVGSIAYYFEEILRDQAKQMGIRVGSIIKRPIEGLVEYHSKYTTNFQ